MKNVAIWAAIGIAVAAAVMAAPYAGVQIPLPLLMQGAAALSLGAAAAVLARAVLDRPQHRTLHADLGKMRLKKVPGLIDRFPTGSGTLQLSVRPDSKVESLDVFKHPAQYTNKDIVVSLKASSSTSFNPVELKKLFLALRDQLGFLHLVLLDKHDEFVGYIPGFAAKREFTGPGAEGMIAKYVADVFADPANSVYLRQIDGAGKVDTISNDAKVSDAVEKVSGGFRTLVVLEGGSHRRPIGLVNFNGLMGHTLGAQLHQASMASGVHAHTIGAFRPTR
jgi:hypothetical protein